MKLTILGSASADPNPKRTCPGYLLEIGKNLILLDSGSGVIRKIVQAKIDFFQLDYLLYTHTHADHVSDLSYLLFTYGWQRRKKDLVIIGPKKFKSFVNSIIKIFAKKFEKVTKYKTKIIEVENSRLKMPGFTVTTKKMNHDMCMFLPYSVGYRIESQGKVFVYTGDTTYCENLIKLAKNADCLLIEGGMPKEFKDPAHFTPAEAAKIATEAGVKKLVLTHIARGAEKYNLKSQAQKYFKGPIIVAQDLKKITI